MRRQTYPSPMLRKGRATIQKNNACAAHGKPRQLRRIKGHSRAALVCLACVAESRRAERETPCDDSP